MSQPYINAALYVPIGIPGCGKTTWLKRVLGHVPSVSSDVIRESFGDVNDQSRNDAVFKLFHDRLDSLLGMGSAAADATNLTARARDPLLEIAGRNDRDVHYIVFTNLMQAMLRNKRRERVVPDDVMTRMFDQYENMLNHIEVEGADSITYIGSTVL